MNSINQSNVEIICCELSNPITDVDDKLMCLISTEKRRKLENIKNLTNRKLSLYGELFVRHYVVSRKNIKNCNIRFEKMNMANCIWLIHKIYILIFHIHRTR